MEAKFSKLLDKVSNYLAPRKGMLPIAGIGLVLVNFLTVILWPESIVSKTNLLLHAGIILAILGQLLAWAL